MKGRHTMTTRVLNRNDIVQVIEMEPNIKAIENVR